MITFLNYNETFGYKFIIKELHNFKRYVGSISFDKTQKTIYIFSKNNPKIFIGMMRKHSGIKLVQLLDLFCVDYPEDVERFEINFYLLSMYLNLRILLKCRCKSMNNFFFSLHHVFKSCVGFEREVGDLFGVFIKESIDLRRILTDYGFFGHPLRKDFPLSVFLK